jgi:rare lipoprotein A
MKLNVHRQIAFQGNKARRVIQFRGTAATLLPILLLLATGFPAAGQNAPAAPAKPPPSKGIASWYGEAHRGKLMANGKKFNPDKFTAASWFYPLGTKVRVTLAGTPGKSVLVTITDRGPARRLVREGRIIDLGHAPFKRLAHPDLGLVSVVVTPVRGGRT